MARKKRSRIPVYECVDCGHEFSPSGDTRDCPECGSPNRDLVGYDDDDLDDLDVPADENEDDFDDIEVDDKEFEDDEFDDEEEEDDEEFELPSRRKNDDQDW